MVFCGTQNTRDTLPDFVREFLLTKYGLLSLCEGYLYSICRTIVKNKKEPRVRLFGILTGILHPRRYDPKLCSVYLAVLMHAFPTFSAQTMRVR